MDTAQKVSKTTSNNKCGCLHHHDQPEDPYYQRKVRELFALSRNLGYEAHFVKDKIKTKYKLKCFNQLPIKTLQEILERLRYRKYVRDYGTVDN